MSKKMTPAEISARTRRQAIAGAVSVITSKIDELEAMGQDAAQLVELRRLVMAGLAYCHRQAEALGLPCSYLGAGSVSAKLMKSERAQWYTYGVYLAPSTMSGVNVCPGGELCAPYCLAGSGHALLDARAGKNTINAARVRRTLLFFKNRPLFLAIVVLELASAQAHAAAHGLNFASRLNCTSDLSPLALAVCGLSVLDIYPCVQFYDYTKVFNRFELLGRFPNYDLTFSHDGANWSKCAQVLARGGRVAVVFDICQDGGAQVLPVGFCGSPVVSGDAYDMRFLDPAGVVVGLTYHRTANDYKNGVYHRPVTSFVINENDGRISL